MKTLIELQQEEANTMSETEVLNFTVIGKGPVEDEGDFMTIIATEPQNEEIQDTWQSIEQAIADWDNPHWIPGKVYAVRSQSSHDWHQRVAAKVKGEFLIPNDSGNTTKWAEYKNKIER
tara:strand:- start:437 stop:793 length:357 start_codon:yes stop_codon:yes gene_type:complete